MQKNVYPKLVGLARRGAFDKAQGKCPNGAATTTLALGAGRREYDIATQTSALGVRNDMLKSSYCA
jgi:hypothetical protein